MYCTAAVPGVPSDGTFTQDPRLYRSQFAPAACSSCPLKVQEVLCAEMEARTRLVCDALTDFQRIVSLCVTERHGRWVMSVADGRPRSGWSCPKCGWTEDDVCTFSSHRQMRTSGEVYSETLLREPCLTPLCDEVELHGSQPHRCRYADDAAMRLERQHVFQREYGSMLQRIKSASQGIQESVTR
ncbi:hypothetical protein LDHU3_36.1840:CDS1 [Leishmania donovani]|nr:hypothetical_protein [Leishmania infantum]CAJ1993505.1 hypothetical protein LDHU3_36.1840:CDS1 [Leishmania donovani]SUZ46517.1 hypothetical_protein [Leishmania infantum]VDZ49331.1 hypothetical_protein [Leishmania donovani]